MSRKRSTYRRRPVSVPMLINRGQINDKIELDERMAVEAFAGGWAGTSHYDYIADMRDCLMLAAAHKDDRNALAICKAMLIVMDNIRDRYARHKRFGVAGDELQVMHHFVDAYRDFWMRQPVGLYEAAVDQMDRMRKLGRVEFGVVKG